MMLQFCALLVFHILAWYIVDIIPLHYKHQAKVAPTANCSYMAEMIALLAASALFISIVWFSFLICAYSARRDMVDMSPTSLSHHSLQLRSITKLRSDLSTAEMSRLGKILHQLTWLVPTLTAADEHSPRRIMKVQHQNRTVKGDKVMLYI